LFSGEFRRQQDSRPAASRRAHNLHHRGFDPTQHLHHASRRFVAALRNPSQPYQHQTDYRGERV
jgi:hypothetical protein